MSFEDCLPVRKRFRNLINCFEFENICAQKRAHNQLQYIDNQECMQIRDDTEPPKKKLNIIEDENAENITHCIEKMAKIYVSYATVEEEEEKAAHILVEMASKLVNHRRKANIKPDNGTDQTIWCKKCGKNVIASTFNAHQLRHRNKENNKYQCPFDWCGKPMSQKSSLIAHIRTHTGVKPYKCEKCGQRYCDQSTYAKHIRVHTGEKPYGCRFCEKSFSQSGNCRRHEKAIHNKLLVCMQ